jgi:hypothetical protein
MALSYEIIETPGSAALERLDALARQGQGEGFYPVLIGGTNESGDVEPFEFEEELVEQDLAAFPTIQDSAPDVFARLRAEFLADVEENDEATDEDDRFDDGFDTVTVNDLPEVEAEPSSITAHLDDDANGPLKRVLIVKVPTAESWLAPIYLEFGGWNACPEPLDHAVIAKFWADKYGAKIKSITSDTVEFEVARPPQTKEEALELAKQHYTYCPDIVEQGVGDIETLAAVLINAKHWFFWWD